MKDDLWERVCGLDRDPLCGVEHYCASKPFEWYGAEKRL